MGADLWYWVVVADTWDVARHGWTTLTWDIGEFTVLRNSWVGRASEVKKREAYSLHYT